MKYNTIVDKSEDALNLIIERAEEFDQERVLQGLSMRHYDVEDVKMLVADVREYHSRLQKEIVALLKFSQDFNKQYATDNNKCFDTAGRLFNRIRSSIAGTKKLYKKFCPRIMKQGPIRDGVEQCPSVFTHSALNMREHTVSLFGTEGYHVCVDELCKEMEGFFKDLVVGLKLCRDVMQQEKEIRGDYPRVMDIYESCCSAVVSESRGLMQTLEQCRDIESDEMTKKKSSARSLQEFVSESFHTVDKSQFQKHAVIDAICKGRRNGLTELESMLWNNNVEFVRQVRLAIQRFDELEPIGQKCRAIGVYKLSARYVAMLMRWCGITGTGKEKQFVEDYFNHTYQGAYKKIGSSSVNTAKNRFTDMEYDKFCETLTEIILTEHKHKPMIRLA
ncbi:MAG: hypothetical protein Q4A08_00990 [Bacteroidales bacterium]|nr:hypothetical protein [Bacteroidales bacterium]